MGDPAVGARPAETINPAVLLTHLSGIIEENYALRARVRQLQVENDELRGAKPEKKPTGRRAAKGG
jgi:hypothetical protein